MAKQAFITIRDQVNCFVTGLNPEHNEALWHQFGIYVDGYRWMMAFKLGRWDGKVRFFEKTGKTYFRLLDEIIPKLDSWGYELILKDERQHSEAPVKRASLDQFIDYGINMRPYQVDAVNTMVDYGYGHIVAATGAGKSIMAASLCDIYGSAGYRTMTIVPSSDLVTQTAAWFLKCGLDAGEYSYKIICTYQEDQSQIVDFIKYHFGSNLNSDNAPSSQPSNRLFTPITYNSTKEHPKSKQQVRIMIHLIQYRHSSPNSQSPQINTSSPCTLTYTINTFSPF